MRHFLEFLVMEIKEAHTVKPFIMLSHEWSYIKFLFGRCA